MNAYIEYDDPSYASQYQRNYSSFRSTPLRATTRWFILSCIPQAFSEQLRLLPSRDLPLFIEHNHDSHVQLACHWSRSWGIRDLFHFQSTHTPLTDPSLLLPENAETQRHWFALALFELSQDSSPLAPTNHRNFVGAFVVGIGILKSTLSYLNSIVFDKQRHTVQIVRFW